MLRTGELDCAIMAEPFPDTGLAIAPLYDEPFMVALPKAHALAKRKSISAEELKRETMLLLGTGHCFRDHVLEVCPEYARFSSDAEGMSKSFEGSSLETIKYMVASGMGVTVVPQLVGAGGEAAARRLRAVRRSRRRRAASCSPGGAASPATRRSPRCATRSMPASCKGVKRLTA